MHRFRALGEELFDVPGGLADAVLVLDQRDTNETLAVFPKAQPRRDGDARLLDEQFGELDRAHRLERLGHRRPGKHRRRWRGDVESGAPEALYETVGAALVGGADLFDARLRTVECSGRRHLDRREGAIVEIR